MNPTPIVLISGLFGSGPTPIKNRFSFWDQIGKEFEHFGPFFYTEPGPFSSYHDRACEIFYQLKGGCVDYGAEHADEFQHQRFGEHYQGLYPQWNEENPVHLICFSTGVPTARMLQNLLHQKKILGESTQSTWIKSITSFAGVNNGSVSIYHAGLDESSLQVTPYSKIHFMGKCLGLINQLQTPWQHSFYDLKINHWKEKNSSRKRALFRRNSHSDRFLQSKDNCLYDLTLERMSQLNQEWHTFPHTYYLGLTTACTRQWGKSFLPTLHTNPLFASFAFTIGNKKIREQHITAFNADDWKENDGLLSTQAQKHPSTAGNHTAIYFDSLSTFNPQKLGVWNMCHYPNLCHIDFMIPLLKKRKIRSIWQKYLSLVYSIQ